MKSPLPLFLGFALLALAGCATVENRIEEKSAVFNSLDAQTQSKIKQGIVDVGYDSDMVYIALGKPDSTRQSTTADGVETTWIYKSYYQDYEGTRFVGYSRRVYYDPVIKAYRVYLSPVHADVYRDRVEESTRVVFKNGKVSVIEQAQE